MITKLVLKHEGTEQGKVIGPLFKETKNGGSERYFADGRWTRLDEAEKIAKKHKVQVEVF